MRATAHPCASCVSGHVAVVAAGLQVWVGFVHKDVWFWVGFGFGLVLYIRMCGFVHKDVCVQFWLCPQTRCCHGWWAADVELLDFA